MYPVYLLINDSIEGKYFKTKREQSAFTDGLSSTQNPNLSITYQLKNLYKMTTYNELRGHDIEELVNSNWNNSKSLKSYFDLSFKNDIKLSKKDYEIFFNYVKTDVTKLIKEVCW